MSTPFPSRLPARGRLAAALAFSFLALAATGAGAQHIVYTTPGYATPGPSPHAEDRPRQVIPLAGTARNAAIADGVTTGVAVMAGGVELNPLGAIASVAVKPLLIAYAKSRPEDRQADYFSAYAAVWSGAAANNLCVAAALVSAGGFAPACVALGVAWGAKTWHDAAPERRFWKDGCPRLREAAGDAGLQCAFVRTPGELQQKS